MLSSSRFAVAIHAMSILARNSSSNPVCSSYIAKSVHTNPVVIRRLMSELEDAQLVSATAGRSGGFSLARSADTITLADIYCAVEDETVFRMHKMSKDSDCPIASQLQSIIGPPLKAAEQALTASLNATTLQKVAMAIA
jgi:Rrf2 family protein